MPRTGPRNHAGDRMTNSALVTIVIPTYNRAALIGHTIRNVFEQTYPNIEVIVVDDGSTDDTSAALERFGNQIRVIKQTNAGPSAARNRGLEAARGEIIAFQDSDDSWDPAKLARQVRLLERAGPSVACCLCNARLLYSNEPATTSFGRASFDTAFAEGLWTNVPEVLATRFLLFNQCAAIRTDVLRKLGGYNESMRLLEDNDLAMRLAFASPVWAYIRDPLVTWQQGSPHSLFEGASKGKATVQKYQIEVRESALARISGNKRFAQVEPILARELRHDRRELWLTRLGERKPMGQWVGRLLWRMERVRIGVVRRVPGHSRRPVLVPLNAGESNPTSVQLT